MKIEELRKILSSMNEIRMFLEPHKDLDVIAISFSIDDNPVMVKIRNDETIDKIIPAILKQTGAKQQHQLNETAAEEVIKSIEELIKENEKTIALIEKLEKQINNPKLGGKDKDKVKAQLLNISPQNAVLRTYMDKEAQGSLF